MILKITLWKQFKLLFSLILITSLYLGGLIYAEIPFEKRAVLLFSLPYLIFFFFPVAIIHLNYYLNGTGIIYKIDENGITKITDSKEEFISIAEIKEITYFMMPNRLLNSAVRSLPFEDYYYVQILTTDKKVLFISCLFSTKIDKILEANFKELNIIKLKVIFPLIRT